MRKFLSLFLIVLPTLATAETITFEADSEIMTVRITQSFDNTVVDVLGPTDGSILCVAMDQTGTPLATTTGFADMGMVSFRDLDADTVASVACRYN